MKTLIKFVGYVFMWFVVVFSVLVFQSVCLHIFWNVGLFSSGIVSVKMSIEALVVVVMFWDFLLVKVLFN